ncbi:MAG: DUF2721 domain-containing protein [Rhodocyclaceae bacterium]|nr:DUF2721 domain-containing protein [Rhodocyclaceae bacterium]
MVTPLININDVPQAIQLALGPVFLLTGIAGTLNVMAGRLARIIDRARLLTEQDLSSFRLDRKTVQQELACLEIRRKWASAAITSCTFAALLGCTVIVVLFLEAMLGVPLKWLAGMLFAGSTIALVVGLSFFLREVLRASQSIRIQVLAEEASEKDRTA